jgi:hypothetical protein
MRNPTLRLLWLSFVLYPALVQAQDSGANPADAVLQHFIDASGGAATLAAVHTRVVQSTLQSGWLKVTVKTTQVWPDRTLVEARLPLIGKTATSGYDGSIAWSPGDGGSPERLQGRRFNEYVMDQRLDRTARMLELYPGRRLLSQQGGAAVVELTTAYGTHEQWTFDTVTGLLRSVDAERDEGPKKGVVRVQAAYDDYRTVDGLTLPFHMSMSDKDKKFTATITQIDNNAAVDAGIITPPAELVAK